MSAVGLYGDPAELDRMAARLRARAGQIRDEAAAHETRGHAAKWVSDGAAAYRERLSRDRAAVERQAGEIEHAARLLDEHAASVRETLAEIAVLERQGRRWIIAAAERGLEALPDPGFLPGRGAR